MNAIENNAYFWQKIDTLVSSSSFVLQRKKNESHPQYPNLVYPVMYGYLSDTKAAGEGINLYKGSLKQQSVQALIVAADILKKDLEVKLVVGCTEEEELSILQFLNQTDLQKTILIRRGTDLPSWSVTD